MNINSLLSQGKALPLMEEFSTIQGEGFHTGSPAHFIRIGGCDIACQWCDIKESWNEKLYPPTLTDEIISKVIENTAKTVVVTGGEPLMYKLDYLTGCLKHNGLKTHLETSGAYPLTGQWDWICLSPKKNAAPLPEIYNLVNELKVIISKYEDLEWAEKNAAKVKDDCLLYLQPEWSQRKKTTPMIVEYVIANPNWKISIQSHKFIGIP